MKEGESPSDPWCFNWSEIAYSEAEVDPIDPQPYYEPGFKEGNNYSTNEFKASGLCKNSTSMIKILMAREKD